MQVVPNFPHPDATGSERLVLKLLRGVPWGGPSARALNSLNLPKHLYQRWGEIDFLVIGEPGMIAIEVKGGAVSCQNGVWRYEDRVGRVVKRSKSPVVQAKEAYFSLIENYVQGPMGRGFGSSVPTGFCVILAGSGKAELEGLLGTPDLPVEVTGTKEDVANVRALDAFLRRVAGYWKSVHGSRSSIHPNDVAKLVRLLRPEFEKVQAIALSKEQVAEELLTLTQEQYEALDHWDGANRIFCNAPAGCGKTLLAVEMFRRARRDGKDALLICGTNELALAIRSQFDVADGVLSLEDLRRGDCRALGNPADLVIIDEGQQALSASDLEVLDASVKGGIEDGVWAWFGDANHQLPVDAETARAGIERLSAAANVRPRLRKNCRNTPEIVQFAELAAGVRLGHAITKGRGEIPTKRQVPSVDEMADAVASKVNSWMSQYIEPSDICILAPTEADAERIAVSAATTGGFRVQRWAPANAQADVVRYSGVDSFRGLESQFVVLCVPGFDATDEELRKLFYLAMTRANFALEFLAPPDLMERFRLQVMSSAAKLAEG